MSSPPNLLLHICNSARHSGRCLGESQLIDLVTPNVPSQPKPQQLPNYGDQLAKLRRQRGWSQRELAIRAGISNATVSRIESGALTGFTVTIASMLASALECDLAKLLTSEDAG